ncbi:transcription initiation factor TFIID subunit 4 isoform X2 [Onthophagus taurus]|uniref:transcription initiation factor TFIID subunit 4 isoform X2 n=1 Tax=Onthophagus taurus TaxID=166361 RepID=UPI000C2042B0|nr:transcription initiation factor TFIID subunit 4 isoform X2 [Onthophagus taurus]
MASAKFLEEALNTQIDESAVSELVGSLENQLGTSTSQASNQNSSAPVLNQNHVNGGTAVPSQKHGAIANGESVNVVTTADGTKILTNNSLPGTIITATAAQVAAGAIQQTPGGNFVNQAQVTIADKVNEGVKIVYSQAMSGTGTVLTNRVPFPTQNLPNGTIGLQPITTTVQTIQAKPQAIVIKTSAAPGSAAGLVTVPMTATVPQVNNQLTLQSLHGLQPGQQGHLLLKTENGQYQLLRVGPAPQPAGLVSTQTGQAQPVTLRMQTVPVTTTAVIASNAVAATAPAPTAVTNVTTATGQKPANDNTKEKCRKFLANLLELSSKEPKSVERSVRTLIQELIDMRVEPEDFCDRLERLLNASPQPCLIGFLKKSLPLLRHSLATKELSIDGIRPPPANVVFSIATGTPTVQTQVRPATASTQVRLMQPGTTVVRPQVLHQRLVAPIRPPGQPTRMVTTIRQGSPGQQVIVSSSQPPALHPVFPNNQVRPGTVNRQPMIRTVPTPGQVRQPVTIRTTTPVAKGGVTNLKMQGTKPVVPSAVSKITTKEKEKKSFSLAYAGDDDINDVAAMGGVNLLEETQRILGSTDYVGTQIRSCKEEYFLNMGCLQNRIRQVMVKHGIEEASSEVAAAVSHVAQERLKDLIEKLAIITEHRLEMIKSDPRYDVTTDIKGQLKFLEDLDRAERKRHDETEREMLLKAAKSRSKSEDPEQAKLKAKAKEMQRVEMEELRQREANATALQAIGPRKRIKLDGDSNSTNSQVGASGNFSVPRSQLPLRQRMKKITLRDLHFLFETEKDLCRSTLLYKSYLK